MYNFYRLTFELVKVLENKQKTAKMRFYQSWQPQIDNIRTEISLSEAEIQENLDSLESFLNDLKQ